MEFASVTERTFLVDPAGNRAEQVIEHRTDPLTGTVASVNTALGEKARAFVGSADLDLLRELEEELGEAINPLIVQAAKEFAGAGLASVCEAVGIPPVLHLGACIDNCRILVAATAMVGMLRSTASKVCSELALMKKSSLPTGSRMRLFTFGPPGTMVTSRPYLL